MAEIGETGQDYEEATARAAEPDALVILENYDARVAELEEALRLVDADVRHHLRSDEVHTALIRPKAIRAVRAALQKSTS
jgi:cytidylate kinase